MNTQATKHLETPASLIQPDTITMEYNKALKTYERTLKLYRVLLLPIAIPLKAVSKLSELN